MISLPSHFRYEYCDLWGSLFLGNLPRVAEICRSWGFGAGSEELISSVVLLRRPGAGSTKGGNTAMEKRNTEKKGAGERNVETRREGTPAEAKARELEAQRAMKRKLKGFLENYDLIPKVCIGPWFCFCLVSHSDIRLPNPGTHLHRSLDAHHPGE